MATTTGPIYEVGAPFTEQINYSNPLGQKVQPVWHRNERLFVLTTDVSVVWQRPPAVPVNEYIFYYGAPDSSGGLVPGQFPVFSLIPGRFHYQPIAHIVNVYVPATYEANSLRSQEAILVTDYPVVETDQSFVRVLL